MRKILLATTALVAVGGVSAASAEPAALAEPLTIAGLPPASSQAQLLGNHGEPVSSPIAARIHGYLINS